LIMLGYLQHTNIFKRIAFDLRTIKIIARAKDRRASSILNEVVRELESEGIKVLPSTYLMEDALAPKGACGRQKPSGKETAEALFAFKMAKSLASLDIGQSVIVKNTSVTAAESLEGTDDCIVRGAKIGGKGFVLAKAAGPKRDMRFDVPVIGLRTIETVIKHGGRGIVLEAGKTFLLDREEAIKKADRHGIFILGV
jgi:UDP-2,3-diacylglucosamine hydrolase